MHWMKAQASSSAHSLLRSLPFLTRRSCRSTPCPTTAHTHPSFTILILANFDSQVVPVYSLPDDGSGVLIRSYTMCPAYDARLVDWCAVCAVDNHALLSLLCACIGIAHVLLFSSDRVQV